ncbi:hypothetical protein [Gymnodinialimonas hymeniacidonis]|uniref:hypothetical protein n=1 Tax=Gymnodinialimonas hymeniacidonis TaxID=3126508 RepID=UPI0034C617DE
MTEADAILILCALLGGEPEQRVPYDLHAISSHVRVDCITDTHAIEVGLDQTRGAYDSVHQATFNAIEAGLEPMVVLVDTDGIESQYEYQIETVSRHHGVAYHVFDENYLIRWQMTQPFRLRAARP